jgi:hypothetical protein
VIPLDSASLSAAAELRSPGTRKNRIALFVPALTRLKWSTPATISPTGFGQGRLLAQLFGPSV